MTRNSKHGASRRNRAIRKLKKAKRVPQEIRYTLEALICFLGPKTNYCAAWPAVATLAKDVGRGESTVRRHLKAIREMGIFKYEMWGPKTLIAYVEEKYGFTVSLNFNNSQAPTLWEINTAHPLWSSANRLPEDVIQQMVDAVESVNSNHNKATTSRFSKDPNKHPRPLANESPKTGSDNQGPLARPLANERPRPLANENEEKDSYVSSIVDNAVENNEPSDSVDHSEDYYPHKGLTQSGPDWTSGPITNHPTHPPNPPAPSSPEAPKKEHGLGLTTSMKPNKSVSGPKPAASTLSDSEISNSRERNNSNLESEEYGSVVRVVSTPSSRGADSPPNVSLGAQLPKNCSGASLPTDRYSDYLEGLEPAERELELEELEELEPSERDYLSSRELDLEEWELGIDCYFVGVASSSTPSANPVGSTPPVGSTLPANPVGSPHLTGPDRLIAEREDFRRRQESKPPQLYFKNWTEQSLLDCLRQKQGD